MIRWIKRFKVKRQWIKDGKPMQKYEGSNCGCCGKWIEEPFEVPKYIANKWWDTWGLCKSCALASDN